MSQLLDIIDQTIKSHEDAIQHLKSYRQISVDFSSRNGMVGQTTSKVVTSSKEEKTPVAKKPRASEGGNELSLREVVWQIFSRKENKNGIKVKDIVSVIKEEGVWTTDGELANMVSGTVYKFKKDEKIVRGDDRTYKIVDGATLD